jgi:hypothetical protein
MTIEIVFYSMTLVIDLREATLAASINLLACVFCVAEKWIGESV